MPLRLRSGYRLALVTASLPFTPSLRRFQVTPGEDIVKLSRGGIEDWNQCAGSVDDRRPIATELAP